MKYELYSNHCLIGIPNSSKTTTGNTIVGLAHWLGFGGFLCYEIVGELPGYASSENSFHEKIPKRELGE